MIYDMYIYIYLTEKHLQLKGFRVQSTYNQGVLFGSKIWWILVAWKAPHSMDMFMGKKSK